MTTIDPTTVPPFPIYTLELDARGRLQLDGFTIPVSVGEDPIQAGHQAIAERARNEGLRAVRVRAVAGDVVTALVVTDDGAVHSLGEIDAEASPRRRPRWVIGAVAGLAVVALGSVGFAVAAGAGAFDPPQPTAAPVYTPPGQGARLPVFPPPGFSPDASWSLPVRSGSTPIAVNSSEAALILDDGTLSVRSLSDAREQWRSISGTSGTRVELAQIAGTRVLVSAAGAGLTAWNLDSDQGASQVYSFPTGGKLSVDGSAPLMTLPNQTAGIVTSEGARTVDIPATSTAVLARENSVIAANGEVWWEVSADNRLTSNLMPIPDGVDGQPRTIRGVDDQHIVVVWPTGGRAIIALVNLKRNEIIATAAASTASIGTNATLLRSIDGDTAVLGSVFIDHGDNPAVIPLDRMVPTAVDGDTVYGTSSGVPVLAARDADFTAQPFTDQTAGDREPVVVATGDVVLVVADKLRDHNVYATQREIR